MTTVDELLDPWAARRAAARKIQYAEKVRLPELAYWNYGPCPKHKTAEIDCEFRSCGGDFFDHQTVSIAWLYLNGSGMIASVPGSGKTNIALGLCAMLKEKGELTDRAVIVVQTPAVMQWWAEARRFTPRLRVEAAYSGLERSARRQKYAQDWDVLIIGYHMLMRDRDVLARYKPGVVITDDVDPLLDHGNLTHKAIVQLADKAERVIVMNASNVQTRLEQLHAAMVPVGGNSLWGNLTAFQRRYVRTESFKIVRPNGRVFTAKKNTGYKNMKELRSKLAPWVIRHGYEDLKDVRMPEIMPPENVWLELHPKQRKMYEELREGVLRLQTEHGEKVKHAAAIACVTYGQAICAGIPALKEGLDGPGASVKLDWLMEQLAPGGVWEDRKVVTFMKNVGMIRAFQRRLEDAGIGFATIWGEQSDPAARRAEQQRFWSDPKCRVFMGTSAIERSLNLQVANIIVNVDTHLNPERMRQILGRVRRAGSKHEHVFVFNLFAVNTQESKYLDVLSKRAAVVDYVWQETNQMYEKLSAKELLELISE